MKDINNLELSNIEGGVITITLPALVVTSAVGAAAYVAKDIYDNWDVFKKNFKIGWESAK